VISVMTTSVMRSAPGGSGGASCWRRVIRIWWAMESGSESAVCLRCSVTMDQASWAMVTIRLAAPTAKLAIARSYWPGRSDLPRAFRTAYLWLIYAVSCFSRYSS
jgi:hypothetical protein